MDFAQRLNDIKQTLNLTNAQIGEICGASEGAVRTWLSRTKIPSIVILTALSNHFGVSSDYLLGKTDIKNKPTTVDGVELNVDELAALDDFRKLSPEERKDFLKYLRYRVENQEK